MTPSEEGFFDRLLEVLLPHGGYVMTLFEAYIDESCTHEGSKVIAVGGYLLEASNARLMETEWGAVLTAFRLPYFHMVDCAHGNGVFEHLTGDECIEVEKQCIALIKKYTAIGVAAMVNPFRYIPGGNLPMEPYAFCLDACMIALFSNVKNATTDKVALFFETGHKSRTLANNHIIELESRNPSPAYVSHTFAKKECVRLLQAADLLAWQSTKYINDKTGSKRPPRKDFNSLMTHKHWFAYFMLGNPAGELKLDLNPLICNPRYDEYLKAMFSEGPQHDETLKRLQGIPIEEWMANRRT